MNEITILAATPVRVGIGIISGSCWWNLSQNRFSEMYSSTFRVLYKLYLSTDVLKYKVLLPGFGIYHDFDAIVVKQKLGYNIVTV